MSRSAYMALAFGLVFMSLGIQSHGQLKYGFYNGKCEGGDVETIVGGVIQALIKDDPTIVAALLRLQFHDCFVNGCDASILLDGSSNTEKTAGPNFSVRGYDVIDAVKSALEAKCPGLVSCADIIVMATRDAVSFSGGGKYVVQTGRKDGMVSLASNVNLPSPSMSVSATAKMFAKKGLGASDMVYLLGAHTVGITHCSFIQDRLYNFSNTGKPDQTMNPTLLYQLRARCPQTATIDNPIDLDQNSDSDLTVDNSYYQQLQLRKGILQIDQKIALDPMTMGTVMYAALAPDFKTKFGKAMLKLGALPGSGGEIRKSCRFVNNPTT